MPEPGSARGSRRRLVLGPVVVTGALAGLAMSATVGATVGDGWILAWLLLGLTAGYALSGSV
jgi:hypothetical protein